MPGVSGMASNLIGSISVNNTFCTGVAKALLAELVKQDANKKIIASGHDTPTDKNVSVLRRKSL